MPVSGNYADAAVRPPVLYLAGLTAGCVLELIAPIGPGLAGGTARPVWIGLGLAAIGARLAAKAIGQFAEAGTTVPGDEPADALVTDGLFGVSRNPIYVALNVIYAGVAIALTTGWSLLILPVLLVILQKGVIEPEEAYLSNTFGKDYDDYMKRVPRWL